MVVESIDEPKLIWKSIDEKRHVWFEDEFSLQNGILNQAQHDNEVSNRILQILKAAKQLNPDFLNGNKGLNVESKLTFPKEWGLGSSSTLINNIASWAKVDAYQLLELTFGGSGYDIASAQHDSAITYQLLNKNNEILKQVQDEKRRVSQVKFSPEFKDYLYFVYLNKKQNSREGIEHYKKNTSNLFNEISEINKITLNIIGCKFLNEFESLINRHEIIISKIIKQQIVKDLLFKNFKGSIKSLGAWGGDFILVTSNENPTDYFKNKGFETVIPFQEMILK
jgi:mevalonate kinase